MIYTGTNKIKEVYHGSTPITKIYKGTDLVFEHVFDPFEGGVVLNLNKEVPATSQSCSHIMCNVNTASGTKTYKWRTPLAPGWYTFTFNYDDGTSEDGTLYELSDTPQEILVWYPADKYNDPKRVYLSVSTTELKVDYTYVYCIDSATYARANRYLSKFITTVEAQAVKVD